MSAMGSSKYEFNTELFDEDISNRKEFEHKLNSLWDGYKLSPYDLYYLLNTITFYKIARRIYNANGYRFRFSIFGYESFVNKYVFKESSCNMKSGR